MDIPLRKFSIGSVNPKKELNDEIFLYFGKQLSYGRIAALIRDNGIQMVQECFNEVVKAKFEHKVPLFLSICRKNRTKWV